MIIYAIILFIYKLEGVKFQQYSTRVHWILREWNIPGGKIHMFLIILDQTCNFSLIIYKSEMWPKFFLQASLTVRPLF